MQIKEEKYDVGVMVARFQVPTLSEAHHELIRYVKSKHPTVIILLGVANAKGTRSNPLTFQMRKDMILSDYPDVNVLLIQDYGSNEVWSRNVDRIIDATTTPHQKVVLYGGRDSFINCYSGRYPTLELESELSCSGTKIRHEASVKCLNSADFRAGVIWALYNQYPKTFPTVDIAIIKNNLEKGSVELLLGKKPWENQYRFIGGFAEPDSESFEMDAKREVMEETGLEVGNLQYVSSRKIDDWRYRNEPDKIKTLFYVCNYIFGNAKGADDIEKVKWFDLSSMTHHQIVPEHHDLFYDLIEYFRLNLVNKEPVERKI